MNKLKVILLNAAVALLASACSAPAPDASVTTAADEVSEMIEEARQASEERAFQPRPLKIPGRLLGGTRYVDEHGLPIPEKTVVTITAGEPLSLREILASITRQTGIRATINPSRRLLLLNRLDNEANDNSDEQFANTSVGDQLNSVAEDIEDLGDRKAQLPTFSGPLQNFMMQLSSFYDVDYSFDGSTLRIFSELSRVYQLNTIGGNTSIETSLTSTGGAAGGGGGGGGGAQAEGGVAVNNNFIYERRSAINYFSDLEEEIGALIPDQYEYRISPSKGTLLVVAPRWVHNELETYLNNERARFARALDFTLTIYSVAIDQSENRGVQIDAILNDVQVFNRSISARLTGPTFSLPDNGLPAASLSVGDGTFSGSRVLFDMVASTGTVNGSVSITKRASNYQPLAIDDINLQVYSQGRNTTFIPGGEGVGEITNETATLQTGLTLNMFAAIHNSRDFTLDYNISSTGSATFVTFGEGTAAESTLPEYAANRDTQRIQLQSGRPQVLAAIVNRTQNNNASRGVAGFNDRSTNAQEVLLILFEPLIDDSYSRGLGWSR